MDTTSISPAGDGFYAAAKHSPVAEETPHGCTSGVVYIGHMVEDESGEEIEGIDRVPCRRCGADEEEALAADGVGDWPTLDEFLALQAALGSPLYATAEEAERASAETEPGCARSPAYRKEALVEQRRQYVGGVAEEQRSEQERRFEELGLEDFFWAFVRLEGRVDDLQAEVRELREAAAK